MAVFLLAVGAACTASPTPSRLPSNPTPSPLPSNPDGMPAGQPTTIDVGVAMSADNRVVTLRFIGGPVLPRSDPCYTGYAGWARPAGKVLEVAVILVVNIHPPPGEACTAAGFQRAVQLTLDEPFLGTVAEDRFGGTLSIERP